MSLFEEQRAEAVAGRLAAEAAAPATLVDLLRLRAAGLPGQTGYTFLGDGERESDRLTYEELDRRARCVAAVLQSRGAEGSRALLVYEPGLEFVAAFFGCLYAGVVSVPVYPSQSSRQMPRLRAIMDDAQASLVLTTASLLPNLGRRLEDSAGDAPLRWLVTDELSAGLAAGWRDPEVSGGQLAYLQYTSGSTSSPKGVMVTHANLLHNVAYLDDAFDHAPGTVFVTWLPHFHDMGLIYGLLEPLYKGFPCYSMPPLAFVQQPIRWLRAISHYGGTHTVGPNFAYAHCVRRIDPAQCAGLDLSNWRVAIDGSEPVRQETLESFTRKFEPFGFRRQTFCPGYGLAEATLMVCGTQRADDPVFCTVEASALGRHEVVEGRPGPNAKTLAGNGRAACGTKVAIVHPDSLLPCAPDEVGEVWVSGPSVTQGYWNRPEETLHKFHARLAGSGDGPFLRTGDYGFLRGDELYITGRMKDLIIIAGRNYHPQDIEQTVEQSHPAIRPSCCAAFSMEVEGEERLVIAAEIEPSYSPRPNGSAHAGDGEAAPEAEPDAAAGARGGRRRTLDAADVTRAIRQAVAATHEVQAHEVVLLKAGNVPKTSSGKIRRHDCKKGYEARELRLWAK
jgi:acyl-CoA synthetase (AMP-forming)/AMP-acid ligase II